MTTSTIIGWMDQSISAAGNVAGMAIGAALALSGVLYAAWIGWGWVQEFIQDTWYEGWRTGRDDGYRLGRDGHY